MINKNKSVNYKLPNIIFLSGTQNYFNKIFIYSKDKYKKK